jgi:hypothetical protein
MKKQVSTIISLLSALLATTTPAWPEDTSSVPAQTNLAQGQPAAPPAAATGTQKTGAARIAAWPVCVAGFACGAIVGIPICFVRKLPDEFHNLAHGFVGSITDNEKKYFLIPAGIAWLPFSASAALIEAPAYAWKNAYMAEKPFSKEQFSLGQMDDPAKK